MITWVIDVIRPLYAWFFGVGVLVSGCSMVPGTHIDPSKSVIPEQGVLTPRFVNITPPLILELRQAQSDQARAIRAKSELNLERSHQYYIGVGDVVSVVVWEHPELTSPLGEFRGSAEQGNIVYEDGTIFYPYAGQLPAAGQTVSELRDELTARLSRVIEKPQVDVRVSGYNSQHFIVSGAVKQSGVYPITNMPRRVLDAITLSGGLADNANLFDVHLIRDQKKYPIPLDAMLHEGVSGYNYLLKDGDVIHVGTDASRLIYVLGEVNRSATITLPSESVSLAQALGQAGGINSITADGTGVFVLRQTDDVAVVDVYQLDLKNAYALSLADGFQMEPRDLVYVTAAPITRWNRLISNLLPTFAGRRTVEASFE